MNYKIQGVETAQDFRSHLPRWPLSGHEFRMRFLGFYKNPAMEMERGAPETPRSWSSTRPGDNRTHRWHQAAPRHYSISSPGPS